MPSTSNSISALRGTVEAKDLAPAIDLAKDRLYPSLSMTDERQIYLFLAYEEEDRRSTKE